MMDDVTEWKSDRLSQKVAGRRLYGMIYEIPLIVIKIRFQDPLDWVQHIGSCWTLMDFLIGSGPIGSYTNGSGLGLVWSGPTSEESNLI